CRVDVSFVEANGWLDVPGRSRITTRRVVRVGTPSQSQDTVGLPSADAQLIVSDAGSACRGAVVLVVVVVERCTSVVDVDVDVDVDSGGEVVVASCASVVLVLGSSSTVELVVPGSSAVTSRAGPGSW